MAAQSEKVTKKFGIITVPAVELPTEDGEPLESSWHRSEINLLIESIKMHLRGRQDYYAGGNMFIYFSLQQARRPSYRGPDFFVALNVDGSYPRDAWVVWLEDGKYPDVIVELLSPSTAREDLTTKRELYQRIFRTPEYFCYDPDSHILRGWRLINSEYDSIKPNERGWLWSKRLSLWLGLWNGRYLEEDDTWLRFYTKDGELVPTFGEFEQQQAEQERQRAEQEHQRAEQERQRAERAEAELARLRERLHMKE
ncbi:MAG: Uma2 family endonuclease [Candidatus Poribacteria bacterium]